MTGKIVRGRAAIVNARSAKLPSQEGDQPEESGKNEAAEKAGPEREIQGEPGSPDEDIAGQAPTTGQAAVREQERGPGGREQQPGDEQQAAETGDGFGLSFGKHAL